MDERNNRTRRTSGMNTWRAGCGGSRTSGSEGGPEKPTDRKIDRALRPDPYIADLNRLKVHYTMAVRTGVQNIAKLIAAIPDKCWQTIPYTDDGEAQVAECDYTTGTGNKKVTRRLIVRRTRLTGRAQQRLWPDWRHHAFLTDLDGDAVEVDKFHRQHAVVELAIRDLKEGAGLEHVPSGNFHANSAWLQCAALAHNMIRWTAITGHVRVENQLIVARTLRTRLLTIPGRLVNRAGRPTLRMPTNWPWANTFTTALTAIRGLATRHRLTPHRRGQPAARTPAHTTHRTRNLLQRASTTPRHNVTTTTADNTPHTATSRTQSVR